MIKVFLSNDLEQLSTYLSTEVTNNPLSVFQKETFIVQTKGMSHWLSVQLAEKNGIFANADFLRPTGFLSKLFTLAGIEDDAYYATENLRWIIFSLLNQENFKTKFKEIAAYYGNDDMKRLQLATKVADLFDQYLVYRPDYIEAWNNDEAIEELTEKDEFIFHEKWQRYLWQEVRKKKPQGVLDKVEMRQQLIEIIQQKDALATKIQHRFPRVSLFGLSVFTRFHIDLLNSLSEYIDIHYYLFNPVPNDFWYYDMSSKIAKWIERKERKSAEELQLRIGNRLLMEWGRMGKSMFRMLLDDNLLNNLQEEDALHLSSDSLLHHIQKEITENCNDDNRLTIPEHLITQDDSLQITAHYTPLREVEALYNYLMRQIDEKGYSPRDILVLTTDIDLYAPYIQAVFGNVIQNRYLPYAIADRSYNVNDNLVSALKQLMLLKAEELTSEQVVSLLDYPFIRQKFGIVDTDLVRRIMRESNIRFGVDGDIDNDTYLVSWRYGLEAMLLGYAMHTDKVYGNSKMPYPYGVQPLDTIEGERAYEALRFKEFADTLIALLKKRHYHHTPVEWREYVYDLLEKMILVDDDTMNDLKYIQDHLSQLDAVELLLNEQVSFEIFSRAFLDSLFANLRTRGFITGRITFSSLIPMRSLPFKVVAVLGLNRNQFPRQSVPLSFDLQEAEHRLGDRNTKLADRYLFLEIIMSARERLYLSYIGKSVRNNAELPPSSLIDELFEYILAKSNMTEAMLKNHLFVQHPLYNYDNRYADEKYPKLYSYLDYEQAESVAVAFDESKNGEETTNTSMPTMGDLIYFYKNPFKWFYQKQLSIYLEEEPVLLDETEKFTLEYLDVFSLKTKLLQLPDSELNNFILEAKLKGTLPLKSMAEVSVENVKKDLKPLQQVWDTLVGGLEEKSLPFEIELEGKSRFFGELHSVYGDKIVLFNFSKDTAKAVVQYQFYRWVCAIAFPELKIIWVNGANLQAPEVVSLSLPTAGEAGKNLLLAINEYRNGQTEILPFYPKASRGYYEQSAKNKGFARFCKILNDDEYDAYINLLLTREGDCNDFFKLYSAEEKQGNRMFDLANLFYGESK